MAVSRRKAILGNILYKLLLKLIKKDMFHGIINMEFDLNSSEQNSSDNIFVDYQGYQINEILVNGH